MKKALLFCSFYILINITSAQDWIRYFGAGQNATSRYCLEHYDKGYLLTGNVNDMKYGWLVKTDINGNELWNIKIGDGIHNTTIRNAEITSDHGLILCGSTAIYNPPNPNPFIMKLNSCGDLVWCRVLDLDNTQSGAYGVKQAFDGGFVMLATYYGNDPDDRIHLFKFDSGGDLFWHKIYNRDSIITGEVVQSLYVDSTNFLITSFCYYPNWMKPYFIQTDTAGNETWRLVYSQHTGLNYVGDAWVSTRDRFGSYYSVGFREGSPELLKFSGDGYELMNTDLFPTAYSGASRSIVLLHDTNCFIGAGWSFNGFQHFLGLIKTDTLGTIKGIKYFPDPDNSGISWTTTTFDNKLLTIGVNYIGALSRITLFKLNSSLAYDSIYTKPYPYDSLCNKTIVSHTFMPNCDVITNINDPIVNQSSAVLKIFPNPASRKVMIIMPKCLVVQTGQHEVKVSTVYYQWKSTIMEIFDLEGKKVFEQEIIRAHDSLEIDVSQWPRGMYNFRLFIKSK